MDVHRKVAHRPLMTSPFARPEAPEAPLPDYAVGDRVTHDHYGLGRVVNVHGEEYVTVDFGDRAVRFARGSRALLKI